MADLHFFPFYPKDWLAGDATALMTPEQEGAFIRLLAIAWLNDPPCTLPDDDAYLAQRSRLGRRWARVGQLVRSQFQPDGEGRLRNAKLYAVWQEQMAKHERRVQAGSRGGVAKAMLKQSSSNARAMPEQCSSIQNQIQIQNQKEQKKPAARAADAAPSGLVRSSSHWLHPASLVWEERFGVGSFPWPQAGRAWQPLKAHHAPDVIAAHLRERLRNVDGRDAKFLRSLVADFPLSFAEWAPKPLPVLVDPVTGWLTEEGERLTRPERPAA